MLPPCSSAKQMIFFHKILDITPMLQIAQDKLQLFDHVNADRSEITYKDFVWICSTHQHACFKTLVKTSGETKSYKVLIRWAHVETNPFGIIAWNTSQQIVFTAF